MSVGLGLAVVLAGLFLVVTGGSSAPEEVAQGDRTDSDADPDPTAATVLGVTIERADGSPAAPVARLPEPTTTTAAPTIQTTAPATTAPTTAAPPPAAEPEPAVPSAATVTTDVQGDNRFTDLTVRLVGPDGERDAGLAPEGGRAAFGDLPAGQYELHVDYGYAPLAQDGGGTGGSARGIDRSPPFVLEPGHALAATWSQQSGWTLVVQG